MTTRITLDVLRSCRACGPGLDDFARLLPRDLRRANLTGADLTGADLTDASLT